MARLARVYNAFLALEFAIAATGFALFALAYLDNCRASLWSYDGAQDCDTIPQPKSSARADHQDHAEIPLIWTKQLTDSNFALAILSLVTVLVRILAARLAYLPRSASVLYDLLLATLWTINLAGQTSSDISNSIHVSDHSASNCDIGGDRAREYCCSCLVISVLAVGVYVGRVALEMGIALCSRNGDKDDNMMEKRGMEDTEAGVGHIARKDWYSQSLSPVLAFFPSEDLV